MTGDALWKAKIAAFLHDPPNKATVLFRSGPGGHEGIAMKMRAALGLTDGDFESVQTLVERCDRVASGADRPPMVRNESMSADFLRHPVVRHPLSLASPVQAMLPLTDHDWRARQELLIRKLETIRECYSDASRGATMWQRRYLSLWRELREALVRDEGDDRAGALWGVLPADTRAPDHSIWDHCGLVSALAGASAEDGRDPSLLIFAIGPVQGFIAASRKTQDLWAGSWILSWLSWESMRPVVERLGPDAVVFPSLWSQPLVDRWLGTECGLDAFLAKPRPETLAQASFPNRFLAIVPSSRASELGEACSSAMRGAIDRLARATLRKARGLAGNGSIADQVAEQAVAQLERYFTARWAALEWPEKWAEAADRIRAVFPGVQGSPTPGLARAERLASEAVGFWAARHSGPLYGDFYSMTERLLAAVKSTGQFDAHVEPPGARCSQTGDLAPVIQGEARSGDDPATVPVSTDLGVGERLSAVVAIKRYLRRSLPELLDLAGEDVRKLHFPSTGSVAAAPWLELLAELKPTGAIRAAEKLRVASADALDFGQSVPTRTHRRLESAGLRDLGYLDARLLFRDELILGDEDDDGRPVDADIRNAMEELRRPDPSGVTIPRPSPYFALVLADGDSMGEWLGGGKAPALREVFNPAALEGLSPEALRVLNAEPRPLSPALHASISAALRTFSRDVVPRLIERDLSGKLVYSGGDDLLAVLPLRDVGELLHRLPHAFRGTGGGESSGIALSGGWALHGRTLSPLMGATASLSAGVVIAHQKEPFQLVLSAAREGEHAAKALDGKAAFAVTVLKHSGERLRLVAPWTLQDGLESAKVLSSWAAALSEGLEDERGEVLHVSARVVRAFHAEIAPVVAVSLEETEAVAAATDLFTTLVLRHAQVAPQRVGGGESSSLGSWREAVMSCLVRPALRLGAEVARRQPAGQSGERAEAGVAGVAALLGVAEFLARNRGGTIGRRRGIDAAA